jgi:hypothetical protein
VHVIHDFHPGFWVKPSVSQDLKQSVDRVGQVVEHVPSKCEALSSNTSTTNTKEKEPKKGSKQRL